MEKETIEEIKKLNQEVKKIITTSSESNIKVIYRNDFTLDSMKQNISKEKVDKALLEGLHLEDKHLYPDNPNKKHKGKNYYCIHGDKTSLIYVEYILISYLKKPVHITLFHVSSLSYGSEEQRKYEEIQKYLKDFSPKKA